MLSIFRVLLTIGVLTGWCANSWASKPQAPSGLMASIASSGVGVGRLIISWDSPVESSATRTEAYQVTSNGSLTHAVEAPIQAGDVLAASAALENGATQSANMRIMGDGRANFLDQNSMGASRYVYGIQTVRRRNDGSGELYYYSDQSTIVVTTAGSFGPGAIPSCTYQVIIQPSGHSGSEPIPCGQKFVPVATGTQPGAAPGTTAGSPSPEAPVSGAPLPETPTPSPIVLDDNPANPRVDPFSYSEQNTGPFGVSRVKYRLDRGYHLVFSDEFDSNQEGDVPPGVINHHRWATRKMWGPEVTVNRERQYYVDVQSESEMIKVKHYNPFSFHPGPSNNGMLKITAKKIDSNDYPLIKAREKIKIDSSMSKSGKASDGLTTFDRQKLIELAETSPEYNWVDKVTKTELVVPAPPEYLSGVLTTYKRNKTGDLAPLFAATRGIFEARIRLNKARGLFPAFWLHHLHHESVDGVATERSEIDIMENHGHDPNLLYTTIHWYDHGILDSKYHNHVPEGDNSHMLPPPPPENDGFRTFILRWNEDPNKPGQKAISIYIDDEGTEKMTYRSPTDQFPGSPLHNVLGDFPSEAQYILFNLAVGGGWTEAVGGEPDFGDYASIEVDWIRVFQSNPEPQYPQIQFGRGQ